MGRTDMLRMAAQQLSRSTRADLAEAQRRCAELCTAAAVLAVASGHDGAVAECAGAGCLLPHAGDDGQVCSLARRLARLAVPPAGAGRDVAVALERFRDATSAAIPAVQICRQTAHPVHWCWFTDVPASDGCGEVLQLAHRLG